LPFKEFCTAEGIIMETTAPYSPVQNGIVEWLNWTIVEQAQAMIYSKGLLKLLGPEAVKYVCYIKNRSPTWALGVEIIPHQTFFSKKPDISCLEEFRTKC
jgi:hypothetical protein